MTLEKFLAATANAKMTHADRAIGVLWFAREIEGNSAVLNASEIAKAVEAAGFARQNATRLAERLKADKRCVSRGKNFEINVRHLDAIDNHFRPFLSPTNKSNPSSEFIINDIFSVRRTYIESVIWQINMAYEFQMFDCASVMIRRLIETLVVECFEIHSVAEEIKDSSGDYLMFSGLIARIETTKAFALGRESKKALRDIKRLGDRSAHNRRVIAKQKDLDDLQSGVRVLTEELASLSGLA